MSQQTQPKKPLSKPILIVLAVVIACVVLACLGVVVSGNNASRQAAQSKATIQVQVTLIQATPEPTQTPVPEPTQPPTPEPTVAPIILIGSGDSVVDVPEHGPGVIHIKGNATSRYFSVTSFGANNKQIDLLVNTSDPYDGTRPMDFKQNEKTTRLQVKGEGDWSAEIVPLKQARTEKIPGSFSGAGDDVVLILGDAKPDLAKIKGNADSRYFGVFAYGKGTDLLVNTSDPYDGTVIVPGDALCLEIRASGQWNVEVTTK